MPTAVYGDAAFHADIVEIGGASQASKPKVTSVKYPAMSPMTWVAAVAIEQAHEAGLAHSHDHEVGNGLRGHEVEVGRVRRRDALRVHREEAEVAGCVTVVFITTDPRRSRHAPGCR